MHIQESLEGINSSGMCIIIICMDADTSLQVVVTEKSHHFWTAKHNV